MLEKAHYENSMLLPLYMLGGLSFSLIVSTYESDEL